MSYKRIMLTACVSAALGLVCLGQQCPETSHLVMNRGTYVQKQGIEFKLQNFSANMVPKSKKSPDCWIKNTEIARGRVLVTGETLTRLFQDKIENGQQGGNAPDKNGKHDAKTDPKQKSADGKQDAKSDSKPDAQNNDSKLSDVEIRTEGDEIVISGKMKKVIPIHFELKGPIEAADAHHLRVNVKKIKADGLEVKGLMGALGMHLSKLLKSESEKGVQVQDNAILFDPSEIANVKGQITHAEVLNNDLVVDFGSPRKVQTASAKAPATQRPAARNSR